MNRLLKTLAKEEKEIFDEELDSTARTFPWCRRTGPKRVRKELSR
jgi:hypothetical protein